MLDHRSEDGFSRHSGTNATEDRRREPRHEAVEDRTWLGWWVGMEFLTIAVRLIDISRGGAALETPEPPPVGEPVWLCLQGTRWSGSAAGTILGESPIDPERGFHRVRLEFEKPCPDKLFEMAVGMIAAG